MGPCAYKKMSVHVKFKSKSKSSGWGWSAYHYFNYLGTNFYLGPNNLKTKIPKQK